MKRTVRLCLFLAAACFWLAQPSLAQTAGDAFANDLAAAKAGDTDASLRVGLNYYHGSNGATRDYAQAIIWLKKAADAGDPSGAYMLGVMYAHGKGVAQNSAMAALWFRKAAEVGYSGAADMAAKWETMTPEQLAIEQKRVVLEDALRVIEPLPDSTTQYTLEDRRKAFATVNVLADEGIAEAQYYAALYYSHPRLPALVGMAQDQVRASTLYLAAAVQKYPDAMLAIALRYEHGNGIEKDIDKALDWYRKTAALPVERYSHLTYLAECKIDYLEDGKLDNHNCDAWTITATTAPG